MANFLPARVAWTGKASHVCRLDGGVRESGMTDFKDISIEGVGALNFQEDEAVLGFVHDTLELHGGGGIAARTTLASIAIVLTVWARKYPELERRFRASGSSDLLEPVSDVE